MVGHPAHVHLFRNPIEMLKSMGHEILTVARDKDCTLDLLESFEMDHEILNIFYGNPLMKLFGMVKTDIELLKIVKDFDPDVMCGVLDPYISHVGRLKRIPSVVLTDTENARLANMFTIPFADHVCTPSCFLKDFKNQIRYEGYHELSYLHPNYFKPKSLGLGKDYIIVRFISWQASHDISLKGIENRMSFIRSLEEHGEVYVSSEGKLDRRLEKYRLEIDAKDLHSALYNASLYIGEGGTTAIESAVLGTPSIHIEASKDGRPTGESCGVFRELKEKYGLLRYFSNEKVALSTAMKILEEKKDVWRERRERMLKDKVDVAKWLTDFLVGVADEASQKS